MSIGFGKSYQHAGLNRVGVYSKTSKEKGPSADRNVCSTHSKPNEIWRRYTGIFEGKEISAKLRKRGLRILARKISERVKLTFTAETQRRGEGRVSLVEDWDFDAENWTRTLNCGISVEALCVELGCSRHVLTSLLKEHCGMNAGDFLDGLKFSRLKSAMMRRLREAATELWGFPGSYVGVKLMNGGLSQRREDAKNGKNGERKVSKYFITRTEELFEESRADERVRRIGELCEQLRLGTGGQATSGTRGTRFDLESWAISAGYASGAKLKRACLTVCGRTLAQIERSLACEVVQFYLCAEDRQLREIACSDVLSVEVARARELYHGDDAKPEAPFEDEWAKFEELKAEWLSKLRDMLT